MELTLEEKITTFFGKFYLHYFGQSVFDNNLESDYINGISSFLNALINQKEIIDFNIKDEYKLNDKYEVEYCLNIFVLDKESKENNFLFFIKEE